MRFEVLGPLAVRDGGDPLPLGSPAERRVLAVLLAHADRAVSTERLIDELWGEDPPASARNLVQGYVSGLRRSLGERERVVTEPHGYRLQVGAGELDAAEFERLVADARESSDPATRERKLADALGLWRGPFLDGIAGLPVVDADRVRFEEARLIGLEERLDLALGQGRHAALVDELAGLAHQHPFRERLHAQLMLALYRTGRQADALRAFTQFSKRLAEEMGLEPGPRITDLEERILLDDPGLAHLAGGEAPARRRHNLPHRLTRFVGRRAELDDVGALVTARRLVTLTGAGGIGKTSLALGAAAEVANEFGDGTWLIELDAVPRDELVASAVASALHLNEPPMVPVTDAVARHLAGDEVLLVMDNCEHVIDGAAKFIEELLRSTDRAHVLATSREPLAAHGETVVRVPPLPVPGADERDPDVLGQADAVALFVDRARLLDSGFTLSRDNAAAVAEICRRLDGIPLAIELAAARLATRSPGQIAGGLDDRFRLLTKGARTAPRRHRTLEALVDWSHDLLTELECVLFRRLGAFGGSLSLDAAEVVCGFAPLDPALVTDVLDRLVEVSLVVPLHEPAPRYRMLETIGQYARRRLSEHDELAATMRRLAEYLLAASPTSHADWRLGDPAKWYRWVATEQANFRAAYQWAIDSGDRELAYRLECEFGNYLGWAGRLAEGESWRARVLGLLGDELTTRRLRVQAASASNEATRGDPAVARSMIEQLRTDATALDDPASLGMAVAGDAELAWRRGELERCADLCARAMDYLRGDPRVVNPASRRFSALLELGRLDDARGMIDWIGAEDPLFAGSPAGGAYLAYSEAASRMSIDVHAGRYDDLAQWFDAAEPYSRQFGPPEHARILAIEGEGLLGSGDAKAAAAVLEQARRDAEGSALPGLAWHAAWLQAVAALATSGATAAAPHLRDALDHAERNGAAVGMAAVVATAAELALDTGDPRAAAVLQAAAHASRDRMRFVPGALESERLRRTRRRLLQELGPDAHSRLEAEGAGLELAGAAGLSRRVITAAAAPACATDNDVGA